MSIAAEKLKKLYFPSAKEVALVRVPKMNFLMVDGHGDPNSAQEFQDAIGVLYGTCYTLKFMHPKGHPVRDARVQPLEGLWWTCDRRAHYGYFALEFDAGKNMCWTAMIMQPAGITRRLVSAAAKELKSKKNPRGLDRLRFEAFAEGLSVQVMHVGPYAEEKPTIERMHRFAEQHGYRLRGKHHEIYLGDPRRTKPERLKTVLRQPVDKAT